MKFPIDIPFHLFSSCIPVKGLVRSIIYDLQRNDFEYIPNSLYDILNEYKNISFSDLLKQLNSVEEREILESYFDFLFENEFIFFSKLDADFFPKYEVSYFKPYNFSSLIIDFLFINKDKLERLKNEILKSKIQCLVFRFLNPIEADIKSVLEFFNDIPVRTIQLFIDDTYHIDNNFLEKIIDINGRISIILKYNSNESSVKDIRKGIVIYTKRDVINSKMKINDISDFNVNMDLFMESNLFNNFFNKRIYIDSEGNIHRYENDFSSFGNIDTVSLIDLHKNEEFKEFWYINKNQVYICCNCEYRFMCVDNREPLHKNESNLWVLEGECNYKPSLAKWITIDA